ncbi:unnamed protein product [Larinioides sclopetarius]|uniref:Uncharacterized protein n=1 Tax=Larinioides sclopetarius TaxID=280406 RepID=A0AAV1ZF14_9ARAC
MGDRCDTSNIIILFLIVLFKSLHAYDYYYRSSNDMHLNYDDCSSSSVAKSVTSQGSGDVYVRYGDCNPSSVAYYVYLYGSGDIYLSFGSSSSSSADGSSNGNSGEQWAQNIYDQGSGNFYVNYRDCCSSTSIKAQNLYQQGSGKFDVNYGGCSSSHSNVAQAVYNRGSSDMHIEYRYCSASNPVQKVTNLGSGDVHITCPNCRRSNAPEIVKQGSGRVNIMYGNDTESAARVPRNTHKGATGNPLRIQHDRELAPVSNDVDSNSGEFS